MLETKSNKNNIHIFFLFFHSKNKKKGERGASLKATQF